jgi:hypothetical protein
MLKVVDQIEFDYLVDGAVAKAVGTSWEVAVVKAAQQVRKYRDRINNLVILFPAGAIVAGNNGNYTIGADEASCTCKAGKHGLKCWHRPAARMVRRMIEQGIVVKDLSRAEEEAEELFA